MKEDATRMLWDHLRKEVDGSRYRQLLERTEAGEHPDEATLLAYSRDRLDAEQERAINRHLVACRQCTHTVVQAVRRPDLTDAVAYDYYWEPTGHAKQQTAAAGAYVFELDAHQQMTLECEYTEKRIWLEWHIAAPPDHDYVLLFIDPETKEELYRKSLNMVRDGELTISRAQLGFDPTAARWAIAIGNV